MDHHPVSALESMRRFLSRLKLARFVRKIMCRKELANVLFGFQRAVCYCLCWGEDERI
jgi:hypothetical protein